jgi:excisionase family DNA binding protein
MVAAISTLFDVNHGEPPYRIEEFCKRFHVSRRTVENWIAEGLAAVRMGRSIFIPREAVNEFAQPVTAIGKTERKSTKREERRIDAVCAEAERLLK